MESERGLYSFGDVNVMIMGRNEIEALARKGFPDRTYVISIIDTDAPLVRLTSRPEKVLRLTFDDVDGRIRPAGSLPLPADSEGWVTGSLEIRPITPFQGTRIARFVSRNLPRMSYLVCQCEMGKSRSAAVAAAIIEHFSGCRSDIFKDTRYYPNGFVYQMVKEAFWREEGLFACRQC